MNILSKKTVQNILRINRSIVRLFETGIEIGNNKFYSYYEIEKIQYIHKKTWDFLLNISEKHIAIYLKNGTVINHKLPSKTYEQNKPFLFALAWAAQFTELHFYTEFQKELGMVKSIERNYAGKILVLD